MLPDKVLGSFGKAPVLLARCPWEIFVFADLTPFLLVESSAPVVPRRGEAQTTHSARAGIPIPPPSHPPKKKSSKVFRLNAVYLNCFMLVNLD